MFQVALKRRERTPILQAVRGWFAYNRRHTARTQTHYKMVIHRFIEIAPTTIQQITRGHIESYINSLLETSKNRTANAHLTALKSLFRWVSANYNVPNCAESIPMLKEDPPDQRFVSREEYKKILKSCLDGEVDTIRFLSNTGLRSNEAIQLDWKNISPDLKWLTITGKGRKRRTIPLNKTCREILTRQPKASMNFLKSNRQGLFRLCRKITKRCGITFSPQCLRRYFATELLRCGVDIQKVSRLLGHSSIKTTERYISTQPADLNDVTEVLTD